MTLSEISSYELAYQIQDYLSSHGMTEETFADLSDFPAHALSSFLRDRGPEPSVSQIVRICNVLSISMDSLVKGPVQDKKFAQLIRKCHFAYKLKGTPLHSLYVRYLEIWQKRNLKNRMSNILVMIIITLFLLGVSYLILLQPAYQPEEQEYQTYAVEGAIVTLNYDGSYTIHTEDEEYIISASEIAAMDRELFPVQNKEGGTLQ